MSACVGYHLLNILYASCIRIYFSQCNSLAVKRGFFNLNLSNVLNLCVLKVGPFPFPQLHQMKLNPAGLCQYLKECKNYQARYQSLKFLFSFSIYHDLQNCYESFYYFFKLINQRLSENEIIYSNFIQLGTQDKLLSGGFKPIF